MVILLSLSVSILGLAGAVFGIAYATYISSRPGDERDDLTSWTCRWVDGAERVDRMFENGLAELAAPQGFKRVCVETKVGFVLLAVLVGVESLVVILTGLRAWVEVRVRRGERDDGEEGDGVVDYGEKGGVGRDAY